MRKVTLCRAVLIRMAGSTHSVQMDQIMVVLNTQVEPCSSRQFSMHSKAGISEERLYVGDGYGAGEF